MIIIYDYIFNIIWLFYKSESNILWEHKYEENMSLGEHKYKVNKFGEQMFGENILYLERIKYYYNKWKLREFYMIVCFL